MRRYLLALISLSILNACGGGTSEPEPVDAAVQGTWIATFSSTTTCSLGQIAFIVTQTANGAPAGSHGVYAISCPGTPDIPVPAGTVVDWAVNGNQFSLQVTKSPLRTINGTVAGGTMSGTFTWFDINGTFTATKQ
ncbi:MAG: hypothetical protein ABI679_12535 [Gemmatimonadota bacterium]